MDASITSFLQKIYWVLGGFCTLVMTAVGLAMVGYQPVRLAFLEEGTELEAVIYALSLMWLPLGVLHYVLFRFQGLCREEGAVGPHFPSPVQGQGVRRELKELRWGLFVFLVVWPTVMYAFCVGRMYDGYHLVVHQTIGQQSTTDQLKGGELLTCLWQWEKKHEGIAESWWWVDGGGAGDVQGEAGKVAAWKVQPLAFAVAMVGLTLSLGLALWRADAQSPHADSEGAGGRMTEGEMGPPSAQGSAD